MDQFTFPKGKLCSVRGLIETHRRLGRSRNRLLRQVGSVLVTGVLDKRLTNLTDREIGQLIFDVVGHDFPVFQPETTILQQATLRLFRSTNGTLSNEDIANQKQHPACPKCGNEMLLHYGIEERDSYECVSMKCGHKQFTGGYSE